ncbi:xanthine dehydrogenase family protein molybdopterin-binding subunit [Sphingosinicella sp. CPCC 101087]|uniref:xanthine dehydrogenase family protein molybdopterin-binding subunit n=1 Tax=Sphingosinicella sp. CPCC 101087 TaxID=2497754 RepID=UPI00101D8AC4|nr:molybdopterin cofactor-binding domain-containing protein [Sphingosinicella sp. CPCC 101087]
MATDGERPGISRRTLLIGGGAGLGLVVAWTFWPRSYSPNLSVAPGETLFNAFLKIANDGRVIVAVPQAEVGQGVYTSLPQILADELGADWRTVSVEPAPVGPLYANTLLAEEAADASAFPAALGVDRWAARQYASREALMLTAGSSSVRAFEGLLREAGAGARALLSKAAAVRWEANWEELDTREGFVWRDTDRIAFAELAEAAAEQELPPDLPIRGGVENRLTGQPLPRLDIPAKIDGSALFAGDVRLSDMVHVALRSAPRGSRRASIDHSRAEGIWDALTVIENPGWTAVAAGNWWAAARALDALDPQYDVPVDLPSSADLTARIGEALDSGDADRMFETGDIGQAFPGSSAVTARYEVGLAPSAPIEPLTATARLIGDRLEIWAPTQAPGLARAAAARAAGFAESQVTLYPMLIGGGYGRKLEVDAIEQAAIVAVKLGRPVQLTWPRIQEIQRDTFRPPAAARMTAWVAPNGIAAWQARIAAPATGAEVARRLRAAGSFFRPDGGPVAGAPPPYGIGNVAVDHVPVETGLDTGIWRSGAHSYTCFFTECFVDELARAAGQEPLSYRMAMLGQNPRLARVLQTATAIGGWDGGPPGSGMGIAVHSAFGSYVATLVEIEMSGEQRVRVLRAVCAVDCGRVVNPEIVRQQIEGGIIHGISAAVGDPVEIENGIPTARTIGAYRLPILRNSPEVTVELLDSGDEPGGVTELGVPTAAPAVANALFSLTGRRVRTLPLPLGGRR